MALIFIFYETIIRKSVTINLFSPHICVAILFFNPSFCFFALAALSKPGYNVGFPVDLLAYRLSPFSIPYLVNIGPYVRVIAEASGYCSIPTTMYGGYNSKLEIGVRLPRNPKAPPVRNSFAWSLNKFGIETGTLQMSVSLL